MHNGILQIIARLLVYLIVLLMPFMIVVYSDRFRRQLRVEQYVTLFAMATAAGILLFEPAISIIAATALLSIGVARLYAQFALSGLRYERTLLPSRLFPGDVAHLSLTLENKKLLPLSWISITDPVVGGLMRPSDRFGDLLRFSGSLELLDKLGHALVNRMAVSPFQRVTRTYTVTGLRRGFYTLGPALVETSDPFGIFTREMELGGKLQIIVYPHVYRPEEIGLPFRESLGEMRTVRSLFEDPTLLAGSREYLPGDPLNKMHWKATARTGDLQVRISDPSTTAQLMVVVNLNTFQHLWQGIDLPRMEATVDVAASLAVWALQRDFMVGVRSNGIVPGSEITPRIPAGAHPTQATLILEHLAHLTFSGRYTPEAVLQDEVRRLSSGGSIVFVTPIITPALVALLTSRRLHGRVSVLYCGRFAAPVVQGLPIYLATPPFHENERAIS
ncbi:MAG: DUF58 domain-containing protein [Chloroflexota bacterium]